MNSEINKIIVEKNIEILAMIKEIANRLYIPGGNYNWGHVGDTKRVRSDLKDICDYFTGRE